MKGNRTKASKAKRSAMFKQEPPPEPPPPPPKRGRPLAQIPLRDRSLAREAAIFYTATTLLQCKPIAAARLAATLATGATTIRIVTGKIIKKGEHKGEKADGLGLVYPASERSRRKGIEALQNRAKHILEIVPALIAGSTGDDEMWLQLATQALRGLYFAVKDFNEDGIATAIELLHKLGWQAKAGLFLKAERFQRAEIELGCPIICDATVHPQSPTDTPAPIEEPTPCRPPSSIMTTMRRRRSPSLKS